MQRVQQVPQAKRYLRRAIKLSLELLGGTQATCWPVARNLGSPMATWRGLERSPRRGVESAGGGTVSPDSHCLDQLFSFAHFCNPVDPFSHLSTRRRRPGGLAMNLKFNLLSLRFRGALFGRVPRREPAGRQKSNNNGGRPINSSADSGGEDLSIAIAIPISLF